VRRLEDNTLCIARHTSHADLRVDPLAFLRCGPLGNHAGHRLCAALSAVVEVHAEETQFRGLIIVLIILALVILPLTVTIAALVEEPLSLRQRIQSGSSMSGNSFSNLPAWASNLLDRLGLARPRSAPQYFPEQDLVLASQLPPSFWHCSWACLSVSPAKAGMVKASARVTTNTEIKVFMTFSPLLRDVYSTALPAFWSAYAPAKTLARHWQRHKRSPLVMTLSHLSDSVIRLIS
jgi:hypothetical protein